MLRVKIINRSPEWMKKRILYTILAWLLVLVSILCVVFVGVVAFVGYGHRHLTKMGDGQVPVLVMEEETETEIPEKWEEGWVRYQDKVYEYNDRILTFLVMGIDKKGKVKESKNGVDGGQSDANFLLVANPDTRKISLIGINRDTMVDVIMPGMGEKGEDIVAKAELAVQHGFGDGLTESCELTKRAVSELFYGIPIHGYLSFQISGMGALNDAVGGVDVVMKGDMTKLHSGWTDGAEIHLTGAKAQEYVQWRDKEVFESARDRLERQKTYFTAFLQKVIAQTREDLTVPLSIYQAFAPYTVTDIGLDEISYLASELTKYSFDADAIYALQGETRMGEEFEEFYPDKDALKDLMIQVFYREVDINY